MRYKRISCQKSSYAKLNYALFIVHPFVKTAFCLDKGVHYIAPEIKENGLPKRQWLPKGFVIPSFCKADPVKMKIRRSDWFNEDTLPKYVEISGSRQSPLVYGDMSKPVMIVESELDAILIQQEASDLVCCLALGGVSKKTGY